MLVYRYMSYERFLESITPEGVYLKVSRPCEFNDPFDCCGACHGKPTKEFLDEVRAANVPWLSWFSDDSVCGVMSVMLSSRRIFDASYRVFSASDTSIKETENEMLMWSHYGDASKGIRITIDVDTTKIKCKRVQYRKNLPSLNLATVKSRDPFIDAEMRRFLIQCLLTKNIVWKYERERRIVFDVHSSAIQRLPARDEESKIEDARFAWHPEKAVIKEVCLGSESCRSESCRASKKPEEVKAYLNQLNSEHGYKIQGVISVRGGRYGYKEFPLR